MKLLVTSNFSFSHSVFKRIVLQTRKNQGLFGKGLIIPREKPFQNIMGKGENAGYHYFLLFPQCFCPVRDKFIIGVTFKLSSANVLIFFLLEDGKHNKNCGYDRFLFNLIPPTSIANWCMNITLYQQTKLQTGSLNPFPNDKFWTFPNWKSLQTTIINSMKIVESSPKG